MIQKKFSGNIFIFHAFDIGDDINLERIKRQQLLIAQSKPLTKHFKNYHIPLSVELPHKHSSAKSVSAKLHNFGVITLQYKIPFNATLEELRSIINDIDQQYNEQSTTDASMLFNRIKSEIKQARFFHLRTSYVVIQVDQSPETWDVVKLKEEHGSTIASLLRFETETLSEYQKNEILASAFGYYRGDLIIIDTQAAFMYDDEYEEILDFFEFANLQYLELQYFDRVLDKQLNLAYENEIKSPPFKAYLPFIGVMTSDPVGDLGKLQVDISVITERIESSIKITGEAYYSELYTLLSEKLDLQNWKDSIKHKLSIIHNISSVYQHKLEVIREDILSVSIIILIFLELMMGFLNIIST